MSREIRYRKPNMANLRGRTGREIIRIIKTTPPPDMSNLIEGAREGRIRIKETEQKEE